MFFKMHVYVSGGGASVKNTFNFAKIPQYSTVEHLCYHFKNYDFADLMCYNQSVQINRSNECISSKRFSGYFVHCVYCVSFIAYQLREET